MNIHELKTVAIERIHNPSREKLRELIDSKRKPLIITGLGDDFAFLKEWNLDFLSKFSEKVPVQKPESDGVNYFVKYFRIPLSEFAQRIKNGENMYIGAREILTGRGKRSDKDGLGQLKDAMKLPDWFDQERIYSSNLWAGAGNNKTLLHFDPWDGFMVVAQGEKRFVMFPSEETAKMAMVSPFDLKKLSTGAVLHSKIKPLTVQPEYQDKFKKAEGYSGTMQAGEAIFIPAGWWHYVESTGVNIGLNFFLHFSEKKLHMVEPLRSYWVMDNITLWPIRWYQNLRALAGNVYHFFVPRKTAA
jgi:cupin-like protein